MQFLKVKIQANSNAAFVYEPQASYQTSTTRKARRFGPLLPAMLSAVLFVPVATYAQDANDKPSSYAPVVIKESFAKTMARMKAAKPEIMKRQMTLLNQRYDMGNYPAAGVKMSGGKPVQEGVRVKLTKGMTWESLAEMAPETIRDKDVFPAGFYPLPHPNHPEGGMLFPQFHIDEIKKQEGRDLTRFAFG